MSLLAKIRARVDVLGRFQLAVVTIACAGLIMDALAVIQFVFILPRLKHWCIEWENETIQEGENSTTETRDVCWARSRGLNCTPQFDQSFTVYSATQQYDLICDRDYLLALMTTLYFTGALLGSATSGLIADRFGRKMTAVVGNLLNIITLTAAAFAPNFPMFVAFKVASSALLFTWFLCLWVLVCEISGDKSRLVMSVLPLASFSVGQMVMAPVAYFIRHHQHLQLVTALAMVPVIVAFYFFFPESPRWLLSQGREDEAYAVCERIAKYNRQSMDQTTKRFYKNDPEQNLHVSQWKNIRTLLSNCRLNIITSAVLYGWFVNSMVYYGLTLGSADFGTNVFLNVFLSGLVELLANVMLVLLLDKTGRRPFHVAMFALAGICLAGIVPIFDNKESIFLTILAMTGKFGISASFNGIYLWTSEIYPTPIRNTAAGLGSGCARMGSLLAPSIGQLGRFWSPAGILVFAVLSLLAAILCLLVPETTRKTLPQTFNDTMNILARDRFTCGSCCQNEDAQKVETELDVKNSEKL